MNDDGWTCCRVHKSTMARLVEWAEYGESRDTVINKVLDFATKKKKDT